MAVNNWNHMGEEIRDAVNDAIHTGDFTDLSRSIGGIVNQTIDRVRETVADSVKPAPVLYNTRPQGRAAGVVMMFFGFSLMAVGLLGVLVAVIVGLFITPLPVTVTFALMTAGGLALGLAGYRKYGLIVRFRQFLPRLKRRNQISVKELASCTGKSLEFTIKDLRRMMDENLFYQAHLDEENGYLILSDEAYEEYRSAQKEFEYRQKQAAREQEKKQQEQRETAQLPEECRRMIEEGQRYVAHIRECNDAILGEEISRKLDQLELVVRRIFDEVRLHPEVAGDLRKMMEYYLPTTAKLLDAYRELDAQPVAGENVAKSKREIEDAIDTLNAAFEKLLDSLFQDRAWDISSDISVLKTMLAQEGLREDHFAGR